MISKSKIALYVSVILIIIVLETFTLTPLGLMAKAASIMLGITGYYLYLRHFNMFPRHVHWFTGLFVLVTIISVLSTYFIYRQSILAGAMANIAVVINGCAFLLYYLIIRYDIQIEKINKLLIMAGWATLGVYLILAVGNVEFTTVDGDKSFDLRSLRKGLITLVSFIYLAKYFQHNRFIYFLLALLFYSANQWMDFQRFIFLIYFLVVIFSVFYFRKRLTGFRIIIILFWILPILYVVFNYTELGRGIQEKFSAAFELYEGEDKSSGDYSIDARIWETEIALESINKYPITGVGRIANAEKSRIMKYQYFYISDIGLIGVMYTYGILGILIFLRQLIYTIKTVISKNLFSRSGFTGYKLYLFYIILFTISTGISVHTSQIFMMLIIFIELGNRQLNENKSDSA